MQVKNSVLKEGDQVIMDTVAKRAITTMSGIERLMVNNHFRTSEEQMIMAD